MGNVLAYMSHAFFFKYKKSNKTNNLWLKFGPYLMFSWIWRHLKVMEKIKWRNRGWGFESSSFMVDQVLFWG
jgi:hypothetical protein